MRGQSTVSFISTYPPTRCGLATFNKSLLKALAKYRGSASGLSVVAVSPEADPEAGEEFPPEVVGSIEPGVGLVPTLESDFVILQHEFGIYGADDGIAVLDILDQQLAPVLVVLHTVLSEPSERQRYIIESIASRAHGLVVMSEAALSRLEAHYDLQGCPAVTIPHGTWLSERSRPLRRSRPIVLTWGLLGPGKGLEQGIRAMTRLRHLNPKPLYVIAGQTHPNVLKREGERYRNHLIDLAAKLGVDDMVQFVNRYMTSADLRAMRASADICLLPYESRHQVTSGALVEALGAGIPVVATRFPHAVELVGSGAGLLVGYDDPTGIAKAIELLLTDPRAMARAHAAVDRMRPSLSWLAVAERYESLMLGVEAEVGAA